MYIYILYILSAAEYAALGGLFNKSRSSSFIGVSRGIDDGLGWIAGREGLGGLGKLGRLGELRGLGGQQTTGIDPINVQIFGLMFLWIPSPTTGQLFICRQTWLEELSSPLRQTSPSHIYTNYINNMN